MLRLTSNLTPGAGRGAGRRDLSRFQVDSGFDFSDCAAPPPGILVPTSCSSTCSVGNGGLRLAQYIQQNAPPGDIILIGYSMGRLVARDMIANGYVWGRPGSKIVGLITLGTPHLGYPYAPIDQLVFCPKLVIDMAGSWSVSFTYTPPETELLSAYLMSLTNAWQSSSYAGYWTAAAGQSCDYRWRRFDSPPPIPPSEFRGCVFASPTSDGVVCRDSAVYSGELAKGRAPDVPWQDLQHIYVHTDSSGGWGTAAILCGNSGNPSITPQMFDPPGAGSLYNQIKATING